MVSIRRLSSATLLAVCLALLWAGSASAAPSKSTQTQAEALLTSALTATAHATSLSVNGSGLSSGKSVTVQLSAGPHAAFGVLSYNGQSTTIRRIGTDVYQKSTQGYLQQQGMSKSQAKVEANKWFKIPSSLTTSYNALRQLLAVSDIVAGFLPPTPSGTISAVSHSQVNGQAVEVITGTFSGQKGTIDVATHGKPFVMRVSFAAAGATDHIMVTFSHYNKSVTTTAPKGAVTQ